MTASLKSRLSNLLGRSPLALIPVRVRAGLARGARWTLLPCSAYWRGGGELDVEAAIATLGPLDGRVCWDLGAHFGYYTVGLARLVGPQGEVAAFEPDPRSHARCARHVRMNELANVRLFHAAVSDVATQRQLIVSLGLGATTSHLAYEEESQPPAGDTVKIETLVLDDLVAAGLIRGPSFIKVDVEGHGAAALRGALRTIKTHHPVLVMSFHSQAETDGTRQLLEPLGYACQDNQGRPITWPEAIFRTVRLIP